MYLLFFFFNDTATTEIYTLSLHDALPIYLAQGFQVVAEVGTAAVVLETDDLAPGAVLRAADAREDVADQDRKSTRLNSSHANISYAVFCLKKKNLQDSFDIPILLYAQQFL